MLMHERLTKLRDLVAEIEESQIQKTWYDRNARKREQPRRSSTHITANEDKQITSGVAGTLSRY